MLWCQKLRQRGLGVSTAPLEGAGGAAATVTAASLIRLLRASELWGEVAEGSFHSHLGEQHPAF